MCNLVPRLLGMQSVHVWRARYPFSCDHDVVVIGPEFLEQKGNVIQQTLRSMLSVYDIRSLIAICVHVVSCLTPLHSLSCSESWGTPTHN